MSSHRLTAALLAALASCGSAAPSQPGRGPVAAVDEARMQRSVRELVALGARGGGSASGAAAARYRAEHLRAAGLAVRVLDDPETWSHEEHRWHLAAAVRRPGGEVEEWTLERAHPLGFSPSGAGRHRLALAPAAGGALLAERAPAPPAGGIALALVDGAVSGDGAWPMVYELAPASGPHPFPVFGIGRPDGDALRAALAAGAEVEVTFELEATIARGRPRTVEARLAARPGAPAGFLLVCAHGDSDSGGPGANDNASGEAIVLELARVWSTAVKSGALAPPPREVRFAIWGKEIHSSRAYLARDDPAPILGVLNFDQSGFGTSADRLYVEPDDLPANRRLVGLFVEVLGEQPARPGFPAEWATVPSLGGTDSYVFSDSELFRAGGLPSVTVYTSAWNRLDEHPRTAGMPGESWRERDAVEVDYDAFYHSAGDLPENTTDTEPWNMGWCVRVSWQAAQRFLEEI